MATKWTREQQQVIDLRGEDLLVSAAAGSGKTAVLVERIIQKITDKENPVDIDRLLVVTFTKAAAAEMRERITAALSERLAQNPADVNLIRQSALIHNASICTIDSFCMFVVRNHFGEIGLDPNFRMADEGEIRLLEQDVMTELMEEEYQKADPVFLTLVDAYSGKRSDDVVKEMIFSIYRMSLSAPWQEKWIRNLVLAYEADGEFSEEAYPILKKARQTLTVYLEQFYRQISGYLELAAGESGVPKYVEALEKDLEMIEKSGEAGDFFALSEAFCGLTFPSLPVIRKPEHPKTKEIISKGRSELVKKIQALQKKYSCTSKEEFADGLSRQEPLIRELSNLTLRFLEMMGVQKMRRRIVDFSDIAHFALKILVDEETEEPTKTAREFRMHYEEIMIDEYQDSNMVQEAILTSISTHPDGHNLFMVGDVKQSIYRFRQARPELFMEKYARFSENRGPERKIELHNNFRSRPEVLSFVNDIFYKLMAEDLGGLAYNDKAALYAGASFEAGDHMEPEILLLPQDTVNEIAEATGDQSEDFKKKAEAILIAGRIRQLMQTLQITDKGTGHLRPLRYSDIVILFRSYKDYVSSMNEVFSSFGIPLHVESSTGYFTASEVQWMLDFLRVLYNPTQDIPMASLLKSPFLGLADEDLAQIRVDHPDLTFSRAVMAEMEVEGSAVYAFGKTLATYRELSRELPIHQLLQRILSETGYDYYIASMPGGENRLANLDMLVEKAINFEKTSYKGLFHFVRYIDQLQKYDVDYGEADITSENADVVRLMTIHKSKGLEFPVVFVSGLSKQFFTGDATDKLVLHSDLGCGLIEMTTLPKTKRQTLYHTQIGETIRQEALGEELRVLYVALTRAREKLLLTGLCDNEEKVFAKHAGNILPGKPLPFELRRNVSSFTDWVINAVLSYPDKYLLNFVSPEELLLPSLKEAAEDTLEKELLFAKIQAVEPAAYQPIEESFAYTYPYAADLGRKSKYSVSELKHDSMVSRLDQAEGEMETPEFLIREKTAYIPAFAGAREAEEEGGQLILNFGEEKQGQSFLSPANTPGVSPGALRGTAVHRVMECLDFAKITEIDTSNAKEVEDFVKSQLAAMYDSGQLTADMRNRIRPAEIEAFVASQIALRMAKADAEGRLFREKPFVMQHKGVLLQGIIDVFWFEGDELILLDYKTDNVKEAGQLVLLYQTQLELYKDALERIFGSGSGKAKVRESLLYSFKLQEVVSI